MARRLFRRWRLGIGLLWRDAGSGSPGDGHSVVSGIMFDLLGTVFGICVVDRTVELMLSPPGRIFLVGFGFPIEPPSRDLQRIACGPLAISWGKL